MSDLPLGKPTSENATASPSQEVLDKLVLLLVSGLARSAIADAVGKLGLAPDQAATAIAEARTRIQIAAQWDRNEQLGTAMVRLNDCYRRAMAVQDTKTALAVQRELNRLMDLYRRAEEGNSASKQEADAKDAMAAEIAAARAHLAPLGLGDVDTPLAELCRLTVLQVLHGKTRKKATAE